MRTTVDIDDELLAKARTAAQRQRRRLSDLVNDALIEMLERDSRGAAGREPYRVLAFGTGGLRAGVDLDDNAALLDLLDGRVTEGRTVGTESEREVEPEPRNDAPRSC